MSAQNELSPCRCTDHYPGSYLHDECRSCRALGTLKITREEYTTMRAAVELCAKLEVLDDIRRRGLPRFEDGKCVVCGNAGCKCWGECPEGPRDDD